MRFPWRSIPSWSKRFVADLWPAASAADRLGALLHDAPEYVIGDMISPFKTALGVDYRQFEARLEAAIRLRFGLPPHMSDGREGAHQAGRPVAPPSMRPRALPASTSTKRWTFFGAPPPGAAPDMTPLSPTDAQALFLRAFRRPDGGGRCARLTKG